jgi:hypothetical protein
MNTIASSIAQSQRRNEEHFLPSTDDIIIVSQCISYNTINLRSSIVELMKMLSSKLASSANRILVREKKRNG